MLHTMAIFQDDENGNLNQSRHSIPHLFTGQTVQYQLSNKITMQNKKLLFLEYRVLQFALQKVIFTKSFTAK